MCKASNVKAAFSAPGKRSYQSAGRFQNEDLLFQEAVKADRIGPLVGKSKELRKVFKLIIRFAGDNANVIIEGESGTGKELVARTIHDLGPRRDKSFIPVNCGAIPFELMESEFFGHKKGAFTGAVADKHGYLGLADQGTLFLDEGPHPPGQTSACH